MASKKQNGFQITSLTPLTGSLTARYDPTEAPDGSFNYKLNLAVSQNGRLTRQAGFQKLLAGNGVGSPPAYVNWDLHDRGLPTRNPITYLQEITQSTGARYLFAGDQNDVWVLNEPAGTWTRITATLSLGSPGARWKADVLQDTVVFTNDENPPLSYALTGGTPAQIPTLTNGSPTGMGVTQAKVVVQFNGVMLLMNLVQDGGNQPQRIIYSDLNAPTSWLSALNGGPSTSIAGFQDLDYGEQILAAAELQGSLMIYTNRAIWRCYVSVNATANTIFAFQKVYSEPINQNGCLAFPNSLISTGDAHYYASRDSFYTYNPYLLAPDDPEWLRQATGVIYTQQATQVDGSQCESMVAQFVPATNQILVSWPTLSVTNPGLNSVSMSLNTKYLTGYQIDAGFSAFTSFKPASSTSVDCNILQILVAASTVDYSLKQFGGSVFYREFVVPAIYVPNPGATPPWRLVPDPNYKGDPTGNFTLAVYNQLGYTSVLRGSMPLGLTDVRKTVRKVILGQWTAPQTTPCIARLRIGTAFHQVDPNLATCDLVWHDQTPDLVLACQESLTPAQLESQGLIPSLDSHWDCYETGKFLYFEVTILNADGTAAIGCDGHFWKLDFDVMVMPT
jgi:hypothetical protein